MVIKIERLISEINNSGLTYAELSKSSNVSRTSIYNSINRNYVPKISTIGKLAKTLGCKVEDLLQD